MFNDTIHHVWLSVTRQPFLTLSVRRRRAATMRTIYLPPPPGLARCCRFSGVDLSIWCVIEKRPEWHTMDHTRQRAVPTDTPAPTKWDRLYVV